MDAYDRYCKIRDSKGLKDSQVAAGTGIGKSTFSDWKSGRSVPKDEKMKKIANFLGVSAEYLRTGENIDDDKNYYINKETAQVAQEIFENKNLRILFDAARDATPEDLKTTYDMLMALKRKERGDNNE